MGNKTKTYAGKRIVPIPDFIYPHIIEQMQIAENQENNEEKLLFKPYNARYTIILTFIFHFQYYFLHLISYF